MSINVIISKCKKHLEDTDKSGTIIESFLSEFLLITIHREYELFIKKSFIEKINKSKDDEIISYITDMTKRKTSINIEYLKETLEKFNKIYKDEFVKQLESREVNHYNSIISNRIIVAHKEPVTISIKDLAEWHEFAKNVPEKFSISLLHNTKLWT